MNRPPPKGGGFGLRLKSLVSAKADRMAPAKAGSRRRGTPLRWFTPFSFHAKVIVAIMVLILDIRLYDLVRHVAATYAKVASRPKMLTPKLLAKFWEFLEKLVGSLSFQTLYHPADCNLRWNGYHQMDVIFRNMTFQDRYLHCFTKLAYDIPNPSRYLLNESWTSILHDPNEVKMDFKEGVRPPPVLLHRKSLSQGARTC